MAGIGEKRKNKKEQATPDNFLEACKKTCQECGSTVSKGRGPDLGGVLREGKSEEWQKGAGCKSLGQDSAEGGRFLSEEFPKGYF